MIQPFIQSILISRKSTSNVVPCQIPCLLKPQQDATHGQSKSHTAQNPNEDSYPRRASGALDTGATNICVTNLSCPLQANKASCLGEMHAGLDIN